MRYTVDIPDRLADVFKTTAAEEQISQSEFFRKALLTYCVLSKEVSLGNTVAIAREGMIQKELILSL